MIDREKVIIAFEQYVYNFVELTTTDEYNHQILEQVLVLLKEQDAKEQISDAIHKTAKQFRHTIVRCKDCEDACICSDDWVICTHIDSNGNDKHPTDWFCADGRKRDDT